MVFKSGFGSNAKMVLYHLPETEGEDDLYSLSPRMVKALLSNTDYLSWKTRHSVLPSDLQDQSALDQWVSKLNLRLMSPMTQDCEFVVDCIVSTLDNDDDNSQRIVDALMRSERFIDALRNSGLSIGGGGGGGSVTTSNLDALFGAVTYLVDTMHDLTVDAHQIWDQGTTQRERFVSFVRAIPIIETLPIDDVIDYADQMYEDVFTEFEAEYTTTPITGTRDVYRCGLFCRAKDNGNTLTIDDFIEYFSNRVGYTQNPVALLLSLMNFIGNGEFSGINVADVSFLNLAIIIKSVGAIAGMNIPDLQTIMNLGLNNPDPDWVTLCVDCYEPEPNCLDAKEAPLLNARPGGWGLWTSGQGHKGELYTVDGKYYFWFEKAPNSPVFPVDQIVEITFNFNEPVTNMEFTVVSGTTPYSYNYTGSATVSITFTAIQLGLTTFANNLFWQFKSSNSDSTVTGTLRLEEICLELEE